MGDSIASGQNLDLGDFSGGDPCFRAEREAYPVRVFEQLLAEGTIGGDSELIHVACTGASTADLTGIALPRPGDEPASQLAWTIQSRPDVVTITIAANDLGFIRPERLMDANGLDRDELDRRLDQAIARLTRVLDRLVAETDAVIVVTNYHNPVGADPYGVDGCRAECFVDSVGDVVGELNERLADLVLRYPADRTVLADVVGRFVDHGAPNGVGPDDLRTDADSTIAEFVRFFLGGTNAYCDVNEGEEFDTFVSGIDCVHPNGRGAQAYADATLDALSEIGFRP